MTFRKFLACSLFALIAGCSTVAPSATAPSPVGDSLWEAVGVPIEALNPDVRQESIQVTICVPGYTASVRPSTSYTNGVKLKLLREQGLLPKAAAEYRLDHKVPFTRN